jgi:hypothetical protein
MDPNRKFWNQQQQALRSALSNPDDHQKALELFLCQHAMVHTAEMTQLDLWSFDDEVWQGLIEGDVRCIPRDGEHSIAWLTWHIARIEDVTMNLLVGGSPQILHKDNWLEQMKIAIQNTGNMMDAAGVASLSSTINIEALRAYRIAVGIRTREIVRRLQPADLKQKVKPSRLQQVMDEGAVIETARDLIKYWGGLDVAGLLLMPPTRHNFVHLNEALRIKQKRS